MGESKMGQDEVAVVGVRGHGLTAAHEVASHGRLADAPGVVVGADRSHDPTTAPDVAVIGAGVVGCAVAWALTKAGKRVLLIDRADPATAGASFGNVGHIATEQLQPLPSPQLLLSFWRELVAFGGALDIPLRRAAVMAPWIARFARAAFQQRRHTEYLAPLVRSAADMLESQLSEVGRHDLLRRHGHYALWIGPKAPKRAAAEQARATALGIPTKEAPAELLRAAAAQAGWTATVKPASGAAGAPADPGASAASGASAAAGVDAAPMAGLSASSARATYPVVAGVWFPDTAHVLDPALVARAFAAASTQAGASILRTSVRHMRPLGHRIEVVTDTDSLSVRTAVVCAGAWSAPLLAPFGVRAPLEAERGYHVELSNHAPLTDAPILYADHSVVVTPMASRLRASSYLEFAGLEAPPDPRKPAQLRAKLRQLGYQCEVEGPSWMGPRPTLPDYLPGIGRALGQHELFYAVGHQHLGLTLAAVTADLIADLVTGRAPRFDIKAFDLRRFG
jgi:glycine/D-amino acid oxidase-like deaminating enzyme